MFIRVRVGIPLIAQHVAAACGSPSPQPSSAPAATPEPTAAPTAPTPLLGESTITGTVKYEGTSEKPRVLRMDSDPLCMPEGPQTSEVLIVGPGIGQVLWQYLGGGNHGRGLAKDRLRRQDARGNRLCQHAGWAAHEP